MRPVIFKKDATWTWDIRLSNSSGALDADSTPTVTVYKNGTATGESVTVTKPSATTGWYQCSFNPAGEAELDVYGFAENVTISSVAQPPHHWHAVVVSPEIVASDISTSVWANGTRTLSAGTNIVLAKGTGLTGFNDLDASGVRAAVGLSSANLDTQLSTIDSAVDNCESAALQLLGVEGDVQVVIREAVGLDGATLTNDLKFISDSCSMIVRSTSDTAAISFMYPSPSLSLTGQVSINDGNFQAVAGAVTFLRSEGDQYFYSLAYNASDRPSGEGTARYTFSNSGNHVHVMLRVEQVSLSASGVRSAVGLASANLDTQLTAIDDFLDTEIAAIKAKTDNLPATPASTSDIPSAATVASTVWSNLTRTLSSGANIVLAKGTGITGLNDLDAAGIRSAVGLSSANVDTQLSAIASYIDTEIAAIKAKTDALPSDPADASDIAASFSSLASTLATIASYIDTEVAAIKAKTDNLPATPASTSDIPSAATVASTVWSNATRTLSAGTNIVLAKGTGVTGFNDLDAAGVRSAVGLASANLDTQLVAIDDFLDTEIAAIKAKTDNLPASPAAVSNIPTVVQIRQEMDSNSVKLSEIKSLAILGSGDQSSADFSNDYYDAVADAVLSRNVSNVEDGLAQHTLGGAILGQLEWSIDGSGNLTVYKTDGTTELYTKVVNSAVSDGNVITGLE